jgi:arsenite oxidase small subunit
MSPVSEEERNKPIGRRRFFNLFLAVGSVATIAALLSALFRYLEFVPSPQAGGTQVELAWPRVKLVNAGSLQLLKAVKFNYPLTNTPNFLVKLGVKADDGVGPDGDIVAYSGICQHLGCYYEFHPPDSSPSCSPSFKPQIPEGYCCCHGGQYDFAQAAKVISGPPPRPVPAVRLEYDKATGDLYATAMGPPTIFGHGPPGTMDPSLLLKYDLGGGEVVTQDTVFSGA